MRKSGREKAYLALDIGAESGRAILAHLRSGILTTEEVHRFPNEPVEYGRFLHWDVSRLWLEVRKALALVKDIPLSGIGVDTWGVDYALLGEAGELLHNPFHYRDRRTQGVMEEVFRKVPKEEIYAATGIQFMPINTLYQLVAAKRDTPRLLLAADRFITMPDLFNYWLTGNAVCEFTNATTTQLVSPTSRDWVTDLMERLDLPSTLPAPIIEPGTTIGKLLPGISPASSHAGTPVIAPATHDTGSAVAAIRARDGTAFLSSGTWSLLGTELDVPVLNADARRCNFTNEGGVCGTTRLLKNVTGLWMLQCCQRSWVARGHAYEYRELMELASHEPPFKHLVNPDDESFLRPADMPTAINEFCAKTRQAIPSTPGAYVRGILESLAFRYRLVLSDLEQVSRRRIEKIHIIGGGSKNQVLNQFTADATGRTVMAGPAEATAIGNVAIQILGTGEATSLEHVRAIVDRSFPTKIFEPLETDQWDRQRERFQDYCAGDYA